MDSQNMNSSSELRSKWVSAGDVGNNAFVQYIVFGFVMGFLIIYLYRFTRYILFAFVCFLFNFIEDTLLFLQII